MRAALNQELKQLNPQAQAVLRDSMNQSKYLPTPATTESVMRAADDIGVAIRQPGATFESVTQNMTPLQRTIAERTGADYRTVTKAEKKLRKLQAQRDKLKAPQATGKGKNRKLPTQEQVAAYNERVAKLDKQIANAEGGVQRAQDSYISALQAGVRQNNGAIAGEIAAAQEAKYLEQGAALSGARGRMVSNDLKGMVSSNEAFRALEADTQLMRRAKEIANSSNLKFTEAEIAQLDRAGIAVADDGRTLSMKAGRGGTAETTRTTEVANTGGAMDAPVQQATELGAPVAGQGVPGQGFGEFLRNLTPGQAMALGGAGGFGLGAVAS